jgi:hypothetical protein
VNGTARIVYAFAAFPTDECLDGCHSKKTVYSPAKWTAGGGNYISLGKTSQGPIYFRGRNRLNNASALVADDVSRLIVHLDD